MMSLENLKSILLFFLIISSLLLTVAIWNYQPDFRTTQTEDDLIDAQLNGNTLTKREVISPGQIVFHTGDVPVGLSEKANEQELFQQMMEWSLYNLDFTMIPEDEEIMEGNHLEVVFSTSIPMELAYDLFSVDSEIELPDTSFNRIYIQLDSDGSDQDYQLLFVDSRENQAIQANMQNYSQEMQQIMSLLADNQFNTFQSFVNSNGNRIYLPEEVEMNTLLFSYLQLPIEPFQNLLFNKPTNVRSSFTVNGNIVYTDGTRILEREQLRVSFTNPINENSADNVITEYQLLDQVQNYLNTHGAFTFEEPFSYFLSNVSTDTHTNAVEYTLSYRGFPIYDKEEITTISVNWHNQDVYQYNHPFVQILDQRGVDQASYQLPSAEHVIEILEGENYHGSMIHDVTLGYQVEQHTGGQGQVYRLTPTWYVKGVRGWQPLLLPDEQVGGDYDAMGTN